MADYTPGSDDMMSMQQEALADEAQERYHAGHDGLALEYASECWDCAAHVVNYPEEFFAEGTPIFWAVLSQPPHVMLDPSEFDFIYQPQLKALGLV